MFERLPSMFTILVERMFDKFSNIPSSTSRDNQALAIYYTPAINWTVIESLSQMWWALTQETKTFIVNEQDFVNVDEFTYLGICKFHGISRKTKVKLCKTPVLPILL